MSPRDWESDWKICMKLKAQWVTGALIMGFFSTIAVMFGCGKSKPAPQTPISRFAPGQVWKYQARPAEPESLVIIGKVETIEKLGTVVHVKITGLKIKNPTAPGGFSSFMSHTPITEAKLTESVIQQLGNDGDLTGFDEGYNTWRDAKGGVFTITLSEIVSVIKEGINKGSRAADSGGG